MIGWQSVNTCELIVSLAGKSRVDTSTNYGSKCGKMIARKTHHSVGSVRFN